MYRRTLIAHAHAHVVHTYNILYIICEMPHNRTAKIKRKTAKQR
jgi:hypothetical protein